MFSKNKKDKDNKTTKFEIPKISKSKQKTSKEDTKQFKPSGFVSPYYGSQAKNKKVVPFYTDVDVEKRYDPFRKNKRISDEELRKKYGTKYYEFIVPGLEDEGDTQEESTVQHEEYVEEVKKAIHQEKIVLEPVLPKAKKEEPKNGNINMYEKPEVKKVEVEKKTDNLIYKKQVEPKDNYRMPPMSLLDRKPVEKNDDNEWIEEEINIINNTLNQFNVDGYVCNHTKGPTVTQFEISLEPGVMVNKVTKIADNLKMNLAAKSIRIEAPIPGKNTIGIEVPNRVPEMVRFGSLIQDIEFQEDDNPLKIALGIDINGVNIFADISKMPHGLIAGATGSGKSVCINTILISLLYRAHPDDLKLILVDPKLVELAMYNDIAHLATPVITDSKIATAALKWVVEEMEQRFRIFQENKVRGIKQYNTKAKLDSTMDKMPYLVIVIDELADLMMVSSNEVEDLIMRITQKARAAGIHLLVATQRPSTDVVKGTIKSNIPTRIAFAVASYADSSTILDGSGAEKLLGRGDMLFLENGQPVKLRLQGAFISDEEIDRVTEFIRKQKPAEYLFEHEDLKSKVAESFDNDYDELFIDVARYVVYNETASINRIQKEFNIGFNRAQALVQMMERSNIVSEGQNGKAREVLMSIEQFEEEFNV